MCWPEVGRCQFLIPRCPLEFQILEERSRPLASGSARVGQEPGFSAAHTPGCPRGSQADCAVWPAVPPSPSTGGGGGRAVRHGMAAGAAAPGWAPRAVQRLLLLLLPAVCAAAPESPAAARLSLHPPYFNLAEAAKIRATATCGEPEPGGARPRPELYCKLVGGPTALGSGHTIQVRYPERARRCGGPGAPFPCGLPLGAKRSGTFPLRPPAR